MTDEERERIFQEWEEEHKKELWIDSADPKAPFTEIVPRDQIVSATLVGNYQYIGVYRLTFLDGTEKEFQMSYHTIKDSAEKLHNPWAVALLPAIEPLQKQLCEEWDKRRLKTEEKP